MTVLVFAVLAIAAIALAAHCLIDAVDGLLSDEEKRERDR